MKILLLKFGWYKIFINSFTPLPPPKINPTTPQPPGLTLVFFSPKGNFTLEFFQQEIWGINFFNPMDPSLSSVNPRFLPKFVDAHIFWTPICFAQIFLRFKFFFGHKYRSLRLKTKFKLKEIPGWSLSTLVLLDTRIITMMSQPQLNLKTTFACQLSWVWHNYDFAHHPPQAVTTWQHCTGIMH